jgi:GTPase involved in cell partitioning and DNA repair
MESRKNIILDGKFTKITNSDEFFSTNGVYVHTPFQLTTIDRQSNKTFLKFQIVNKQNAKLITGLSQIEQSILEYYKHLLNSNKQIVLSLSDNMKNGCVKLYRECFQNDSNNYIIKISGVWEDQTRIGLTFKFLDAITI